MLVFNMLKIRRFLFLLLLTSYLFACNEKKKELDNYDKYELIEYSEMRFPLDDQTSYRTFFANVYQDSSQRDFLVFLSQNKPSIQIFDLASQKLFKEINLALDGPDGVGEPSGLLMISMDSIYVVSSSRYRVSLVNNSGKLLNSYRLLTGTTYDENTGMLRPYTISVPTKFQNLIYFNVAPDRDVYKPSYFQGSTNVSLDLSNGKYSYFNTYPEEFMKGVWGVASVSYSTTFNHDSPKFVYSFAISDSVDIFEPKSGKRWRRFAGSRFINSQILPMSKPDNSHDLEYALETPYYGGVIYDKFQDMYYRFVRHAVPYKDEKGEINDFHEKPISVILLDKDLNVIGETMLRNNVFLDYIYFVTKDGLFISEGNPENSELKEDVSVFSCFKVKQIEKK